MRLERTDPYFLCRCKDYLQPLNRSGRGQEAKGKFPAMPSVFSKQLTANNQQLPLTPQQ